MDDDELNDREKSILDLEKNWWTIAPTRERAIVESLDITPTRYYLILSQLLDDPRAWRYDPVLVDRLKRLRMNKLDERRASGVFGDCDNPL